jgi:hypothetical protein
MFYSTPMKRCSKCGVEKPATLEFFARHSSCKDGLHTQCKECKNARGRQSWEENKEKRNSTRRQKYWDDPATRQRNIDYHRKWRNETSRDVYLEGKHKWYEANREHDNQKSREWRLKNSDRRKAYDREYLQKNKKIIQARQRRWENENKPRLLEKRRRSYILNPHPIRLAAHLRDARKRQLPDTFTKEEYHRMLEYWDNACAISGEQELLQIDHWIPLNSPDCPGTVVGNMIPLSRSLNFSKQDTDPVIWLMWKFGEEEGLKHLARINAYFEWLKTLQ